MKVTPFHCDVCSHLSCCRRSPLQPECFVPIQPQVRRGLWLSFLLLLEMPLHPSGNASGSAARSGVNLLCILEGVVAPCSCRCFSQREGSSDPSPAGASGTRLWSPACCRAHRLVAPQQVSAAARPLRRLLCLPPELLVGWKALCPLRAQENALAGWHWLLASHAFPDSGLLLA